MARKFGDDKNFEIDRKSRIPRMRELLDKRRLHPENIVEFKTDRGNAISRGLLKSEDVAVAYTIIPANACFPRHTHEESEWLIVVSGSMTLEPEGDRPKRLLQKGDFVFFEPDEPHRVTTGEHGVSIIAITIPPDEGFPNGE